MKVSDDWIRRFSEVCTVICREYVSVVLTGPVRLKIDSSTSRIIVVNENEWFDGHTYDLIHLRDEYMVLGH